jgi:hypothetical protein
MPWYALAAFMLGGCAATSEAASAPPVIDIPSVTVLENAGTAPVVIVKSKASSYSKINVQTVDGTAKAGVDYRAINQTLTLANNVTSTKLPIGIIDNATYQGSRAFTLKLTILRFGQVPASYTPITVTINDDESAPPAPTPAPTGLPGEAAIADNFDGSTGLAPEETPPFQENGSASAYRMFCTVGILTRDDPLVYPGQPDATHLHQTFGNTGTNANSNYQSLRTSGGTTCGQSSTPFNRSAYWFPAMLDGVGDVVKPDYIKLYYKRNAASDPMCRPLSSAYQSLGQCADLPNGIRYLFGANMKTGESWVDGTVRFNCAASEDGTVSNGTATGNYNSIAETVAAGCPVGAQLVIAANSPSCWNGTDLDMPDHRSHMAYATGPWYGNPDQLFNACTADHPYPIPNMEVLIYFTVDANFAKWRLSSDDQMSQTMGHAVPAGSTFHMDYWEAWSPTIKAAWHTGCINRNLSCSSGALGNGQVIVNAGSPWPNGFPKHQLVPVP